MSNEQDSRRQPTGDAEAQEPVYAYRSAGLTEREGRVPLWLWLVVVALLAWGIYYMVTYWHPPA